MNKLQTYGKAKLLTRISRAVRFETKKALSTDWVKIHVPLTGMDKNEEEC